MKQKIGLPELRQARNAQGKLLGAVFIFSIFVNLLMLTGPLYMLQVYDRVLGSRSEETLVALSILVIVLYIFMGLLDYARGRVLARFGASFQSQMDGRVFDAMLKRSLNPKFRAAPATGLRDLENVQALFTSPVMLALFDVPWTPLFIGAIFIFHPLLGWMAIGGGAALIVITLLNNWLTSKKVQQAQVKSQQAHGLAEQARHGAETIRAQGMSSAIAHRWHQIRNNSLDETMNANDWSGLFTAMTKSFRLLLQSSMLGVGAWLVLQGELTAGAMIAGSILLGRALAPIEQSIGQWAFVQRALSGWKLLGRFLQETPPDEITVKLPRPKANISVKAVSIYTPDTRKPVLTQINFNILPGQVVGIIGKSGAGKSTIAKALMGLIQPVSGEIRLGGATLDQYDVDDLGGFWGYLPQQVTLFSGTVAENIARMLPEPDEEKIIAAAQRANAHEMILGLPEGYKTQIQGQDSQLSGGQRQRIALARALYNDPVALILDEPNSALDHDGSVALNNAVAEFKGSDRAVIIMTHRPMAIAHCDRLIIIEKGRVHADGPRDEVLKKMVENNSAIQASISKGGKQ